jgi:hypothetical protein
MNESNEWIDKLRAYRTLTIVSAVMIAFTLLTLGAMIPRKTIHIWLMLGGAALFCLYLIVLCLRLIRELKERIDR